VRTHGDKHNSILKYYHSTRSSIKIVSCGVL